MARYFEAVRRVVERHGGTVEKFIGDAVMAVFGVPVLHEDDALRAVRAAADLRDGLGVLNVGLERDYGTTLEVRIGVNTGEVVTGTEERLATGDVVNVAARLEQTAGAGQVLLGAATVALVRELVEVAETEPLTLKGKAVPVEAYRLVSVREAAPSRSHSGVMVGRERELERLRSVLSQSVADCSCQLFTVLGAAGVGKSRLVSEFLTGLESVTVARGRCLPYGEGITYWPVVEVLKQLLGQDSGSRLADPGLDDTVSGAVRALLGETSAVTSVDEIAWSVRKLLEAIATTGPVVVVFDDIHWGEEAFLNLIDHVADLSRDAPILVLCIARPELLDGRPNWGGGKLNAATVLLEPLAADEADTLVSNLLNGSPAGHALRARILEAAEGNPLFVEEMVALLRNSSDSAVVVPPTIHALLAARLDQLDPGERVVLERGSVEGRTFHLGAVQALSPQEEPVLVSLTALVRRELLRPDKPQFSGEDAFRFRHLLIRDAAYESLPKASRAELHERFAGWLDDHGVDLVELDEVVGYHLEMAHRCRVELGPEDESMRELAERAAVRLGAGGTKATARGDVRAAGNLLGRAVALYRSTDSRRLVLLPVLGRALYEAGEWDDAEKYLAEAIALGNAAGDRTTAAYGALGLTTIRMFRASFASHDSIRAELADAISVFEEAGDEAGLGRALGLMGQLRFWNGDSTGALEELERAVFHARNAGDRAQGAQSLHYVALATLLGPTPVEAGLERIEQMGIAVGNDRRLEISIHRCRGYLEAMRGQFDAARELIDRATALAQESGWQVGEAGVLFESGRIELLAGRLNHAEQALRAALDTLNNMGDRGHLVTVAPVLADVLYALGRNKEATELIKLTTRWAMDDDLDPQISWRRVQAKLLARRGRFQEATRLARDSVEVAAGTDFIDDHAHALADLAEVLQMAGRTTESITALEQAAALYEQKGNTTRARQLRAQLNDPTTLLTDYPQS